MIFWGVLLSGCATVAPPPTVPAPSVAAASEAPPPPPPEVQRGSQLFVKKGCVMCHGVGALGGVANRYALGGLIPPLNKVAEGYTIEELKEKIEIGVPHVDAEDPNGHVPILVMPSWKDKLTEEELHDLVVYLFSLAPPKSAEEEW